MTYSILLIGQHGQVSTYLQRALSKQEGISKQEGMDLIVAGRDQIDLSKPDTVKAALRSFDVDLIINPAAYTAVDLAESEAEAAFAINSESVAEIAAFCAENSVSLIHYSTDYVFAGDAQTPYAETDPIGPTGVYGASKLAGEQAIINSQARAVILRTAWVYSNHGKNFYKTMLALSETRDELTVVADQIGAPTYAASIAEATRQIVSQLRQQGGIKPEQSGVYHFTCQGQTSWCDFAKAIFVENQITKMAVSPIATKDYPTPAQRPAYSVLDNSKLEKTFGVSLPHWGTALAQCAAETASSKDKP